MRARRVTASTFGASRGQLVLAVAILTSCTVYNELPGSHVDPGGEAGSRSDDGQGGAGVAGGVTAGSGGTVPTETSMTSGGETTDAPLDPLGDAPGSMDDGASQGDVVQGVDGSLDAASSLQPILYYKFDETSGDVANDSSGNARTGTVIGPHTWVAGRVGNALSFDGTSAFVVLPVGVVSTLTQITIATWVQLGGNSVWQRIVDFGNNTTVYMFLTPTSNMGKVQLAITTNSNPGQQILNGTSMTPQATWKHIAVVLDGQTGSVYVDGALESTSAITKRPTDLGTTANNWLGRSQYAQDAYFKGQMDDFRIYDRALTAEQVAAIANP